MKSAYFIFLISELSSDKVEKSSIAAISQTGSVATQAIPAYKYFYLNGALAKSIKSIAVNDSFIANNNYTLVWNGALNELIQTTNNNRTLYYKGDLNNIDYNSELNIAGSECTNAPDTSWYFLKTYIHIYGTDFRTQIANQMIDDSCSWIRFMNNGTWTSWKQIHTDYLSTNFIGNAYGINWNVYERNETYVIELTGATDQALSAGVAYTCFTRATVSNISPVMLSQDYMVTPEFNSGISVGIWFDDNYFYLAPKNGSMNSGQAFLARYVLMKP